MTDELFRGIGQPGYEFGADFSVSASGEVNLATALNARKFGLKGDGTTENMSKVYLAVAEAQATGSPLYAPSGRYKFPEAIVSNGPGFTLIGDPPVVKGVGGTDALKGTWFHFDHAGRGISIVNAGGNSAGNFTDTRIQSIGTMRTQPAPAPGWAPTDFDWDIHADGVSDVILRDVTFWNATRGVVLAGSTVSGPGRLELYGVRGQCFKNGIFVDTAYDVCRLDQIHIWPFWRDDANVHAYTMANLDAIYMNRSDNPMLSNVFTIFARAGLRLGGNANGVTSKVHLVNADFDRGYTGIWLDASADGASGQFTNVTTQGETGLAGTKGLFVQADNTRLAFTNLRASVNHQNGVRIEGTGNIVDFSGQTLIDGYDAALIGFPALEAYANNYVSVLGNLITQPAVGSSAPRKSTTGTFNFGGSANVHAFAHLVTAGNWTTAIQAAIASLGTAGGEVLFPPGTYDISAELALNTQSISLRGSGRWATTIRQTTANAKILNITANYAGVRGLSFIYSSTPAAGGTAIYVTSAYVTLDDFVIRSCHTGVHFSGGGAVGGKVTNFEILDYESIGLYVQSLNDLFVSRFIINAGSATRGALGGIRLVDKVEAFICSDGDILLGAYSMTIEATDFSLGVRVAYNNFTNVYFDSAVSPTLINELVETDFVGCWFSGGRAGAGAVGASVINCRSVRFTACRFFNCGSHGATVDSLSRDTSFVNCKFESNGVTATPASSHGIFVGDGAQKFKIIGCTASNGLYTGEQNMGIVIGSGCDDFVVAENNVQGNLNAAGILCASPTAARGVVRDNIGHNPVGLSTPTVGASPYTYTAGPYYESVYISGGTVSAIAIGGATVFTSTDKVVFLGPGQSVVITYSGAPTLKAWRH